MLNNVSLCSLISGVYGAARPIERSTPSNIIQTKRLLLIVGLSGHLGTMYSHKCTRKGRGHIKIHTDADPGANL